jgi:hypothetical protein
VSKRTLSEQGAAGGLAAEMGVWAVEVLLLRPVKVPVLLSCESFGRAVEWGEEMVLMGWCSGAVMVGAGSDRGVGEVCVCACESDSSG